MSDFIDGLLKRNFDRAPEGSVQPRPLARFETPDGAAWVEPPPASETTAPGPEAVTQTPAPQAGPALKPPAGPAPKTIYERETRIYQEIPAAPPEQRAGSLQPARQERIVPGDRQEEIDSTASPIGRPSIVVEPIRPRVEERDAPPSPANGALQPAPWIERETPAGAVEQEAPHEAAPHPQAGPVIQLSIGRIEVIGQPPAPAQQRPAASRHTTRPVQPVRSLDDYLRQRNERRK